MQVQAHAVACGVGYRTRGEDRSEEGTGEGGLVAAVILKWQQGGEHSRAEVVGVVVQLLALARAAVAAVQAHHHVQRAGALQDRRHRGRQEAAKGLLSSVQRVPLLRTLCCKHGGCGA